MNENEEETGWPADPEPADDERLLRSRPGDARGGRAPSGIDYGDAVTAHDAAWWAALGDYERGYGLLRALESACARGALLHLARCPHHLHDLLAGLDPADRAWTLALLQRIQELLADRAGSGSGTMAPAALLAYLADAGTDPRFAPPPALPLGLLHQMYPQGMRPEDLQDALDHQRYPRGKPLPACPVCEPDQADPADPLTRAVRALRPEERVVLVHVGTALALDAEAPALAEQVAWVRGAKPVPAVYEAIVAGAIAAATTHTG